MDLLILNFRLRETYPPYSQLCTTWTSSKTLGPKQSGLYAFCRHLAPRRMGRQRGSIKLSDCFFPEGRIVRTAMLVKIPLHGRHYQESRRGTSGDSILSLIATCEQERQQFSLQKLIERLCEGRCYNIISVLSSNSYIHTHTYNYYFKTILFYVLIINI